MDLRGIGQRTAALKTRGGAPPLPEGDLVRLFQLLYAARDVDFTHYKPPTIERRIRRRMAAMKVHSLADYVRLLTDSPQDLDALYADILIRVTSFFHDPAVSEVQSRDVIPAMLHELSCDGPARGWAPRF